VGGNGLGVVGRGTEKLSLDLALEKLNGRKDVVGTNLIGHQINLERYPRTKRGRK